MFGNLSLAIHKLQLNMYCANYISLTHTVKGCFNQMAFIFFKLFKTFWWFWAPVELFWTVAKIWLYSFWTVMYWTGLPFPINYWILGIKLTLWTLLRFWRCWWLWFNRIFYKKKQFKRLKNIYWSIKKPLELSVILKAKYPNVESKDISAYY